MESETVIALLLSIIFTISFCFMWVFILTWQQIGFVKKDMQRLQKKNEDLEKTLWDIDRTTRYKS